MMQLEKIKEIFSQFISNPTQYGKDMDNIYESIKKWVDSAVKEVDRTNNIPEIEFYTRLAFLISDIVDRGSFFCGWYTVKKYYELVNFECLRDEAIASIKQKLISQMSHIEYHSDGSYGNSDHILFWYPIHQVLEYGNDEDKKELMKSLQEKTYSGKTKYEQYQEMVKEYLGTNKLPEAIVKAKKIEANKNIIKNDLPKSKPRSEWYQWWQLLLVFSGISVIFKGCGPFGSAIMWIVYLSYGYHMTKQGRSPQWAFEDLLGKGLLFITIFIILGLCMLPLSIEVLFGID